MLPSGIAGRHAAVEREIRAHALHQNDAIQDCRRIGPAGNPGPGFFKFHRETAAVLGAQSRTTRPSLCLEADTRAQGVALVLRNGELAGVAQTARGIAAKEQAAGDGAAPEAGLIGITEVAGETPPLGNFHAHFFAENARARESDGETNAGVEQGVVVGIIVKIATKNIGVHAQFAEE